MTARTPTKPPRLRTERASSAPEGHTGDVRQFASGAVRSADRVHEAYHLLSPWAMRSLARRHARGAEKYSRYNWEQGIPASVYVDHLLGHLFAWLAGATDDSHLDGMLWNAAALVHTAENLPHLVDCRRGPGGEPPSPDGGDA